MTEIESQSNKSVPDSEVVKSELSLLRELTQSGLAEAVTGEAFPILSRYYPDFLTSQKIEAYGSRLSLLYRALRASSGDKEYHKRILGQMRFVESELRSLDFAKKNTEDGDKADPLFWMSNEEREGLRALIFIGDDKAINPTNFPALTFLDEGIIREIKVDAMQNRIKRLRGILGERNKMQGYGDLGKDIDPVVTELNLRIGEQFRKQEDLLMGKD